MQRLPDTMADYPFTGTITALDDNVLKGQFASLNFGANLAVTVAGSVATIDGAAGGGGGSLGIMGQDEGYNLGTGTILNVVGAGATLSLSGTVLNLSVPGGGGGGGGGLGIMGQDESVNLGTGTILNVVGAGATLSLSGTVLNLSVPGGGGVSFAIYRTITGSGVTVDLANGMSVTGSAQFDPSYAPSKVTDGNMSNQWIPGNAGSIDHWVRVDMGSAQTINKVRVIRPGSHYYTSAKIETSLNDVNYTLQGTITGMANGVWSDLVFASMSARYVRFTGDHNAKGGEAGYTKVQIYMDAIYVSGLVDGILVKFQDFANVLISSAITSLANYVLLPTNTATTGSFHAFSPYDNTVEIAVSPGYTGTIKSGDHYALWHS